MPRLTLWLTLGLCLALWLAACVPPAVTPGALAPSPAAASPVSASPQAAAPKGGATPKVGGLPAASPAPAITLAAPTPAAPAPTALIEPPAAATAEPPCTNDASFIRDVTIPDGSQFLPGQLLMKKWGVQNAGSCNWGPTYRLAFIGGDSLGAPSGVALYPARAGTTATWEIPMVAPQTPGAYTSRWQARDPAGNLFGAVVFIKISVIPMPTAPSP